MNCGERRRYLKVSLLMLIALLSKLPGWHPD